MSPSSAHMKSSVSMGSLASGQSGGRLTQASSAGALSVNMPSRATKSYMGSQVLSQKSSAPSFSFGSGPARLTFTGPVARGKQVLQPSVASGGNESPGPIYNPAPSKKWLGDAPVPHFGTQQQRPPSGAAAMDISKLTGKSVLPGPGNYPLPSSLGKQALGRCHSTSSFAFGTSKQRESAALVTPSPGPVYDLKGTRSGSMDRASYSFGNEIRTKNKDPSLKTPGPGVYNTPSAVGLQVYSTNRSGRIVGFGVPTLQSSDRGILPLEGRHSPGPVYMVAPACKKQALSTKRSAPRAAFSRADRFKGSTGLEAPGPGPGEYIV